ncbi:ankyrin, partial [Choiromyces venosus 120613-1]
GIVGFYQIYDGSLVIDRLCDKGKERHDSIACFYFNFAAQKEQSPVDMLGSLLKQIVGGMERVPEDIVKAFEDQKKAIGVAEIVKLLQTVTSSQHTFICVDALDKCLEKHQSDILDALREILEKSPGTRVFITGRRHISGQVEKHLAGKAVTLSIKPNNKDIREYIRMRLRKDAFLGATDDSLESEITDTLAEQIPESLLLGSITLDSILRETTVYTRREKLLAMAEGSEMKEVYGATLERIQGQGGERARLGMGALLWISHSEKPLQLDELLQALAVEKGSTELNPERIYSVEILLSCCLELVTFDKEASRVRLIHFSLQAYLYTRPDVFPGAYSTIGETCLTYLNFPHIKGLSRTLDSTPQSTPFITYCSLYWGAHARKEASSSVISLAFELFSELANDLSTKFLLMDMKKMLDLWGLISRALFPAIDVIYGDAALHLEAARSGNQGKTKSDKTYGRTALCWAAGHGHDVVVKELLSYGSHNPNRAGGAWGKTSQDGGTPLWWAAYRNNEGVVKLLLSREDVNPDRPDKAGDTPLLQAAWSGDEKVVKLLLSREDVNPNKPGKDGQTPLLIAVKRRHSLVERLLGARIATDAPVP